MKLKMIVALAVVCIASAVHSETIAVPSVDGATLLFGVETPFPPDCGFPVPPTMQKKWKAGSITAEDLIVVAGKVRYKTDQEAIVKGKRLMKEAIDAKTAALINAGFAVEVGGTTYTFSMASYAQDNLHDIAILFLAGQDPFPVKIRTLDEYESSPGVWKHSVQLSNASQLNTLLAAKRAHIAVQEEYGWGLKNQLKVATTVSQVKAIKVLNDAR